MGICNALASLLRATTQPSLLDSTTTGLPSRSGRKMRSQLTKKLLESISAKILGDVMVDLVVLVDDARDGTPDDAALGHTGRPRQVEPLAVVPQHVAVRSVAGHAVDYRNITVEDACARTLVAADAEHKGAGGVSYQ